MLYAASLLLHDFLSGKHAYKCHMTSEVKEALRQAGVDTALVPGVDENVPLADLEPDIYGEEVNESVVYEH